MRSAKIRNEVVGAFIACTAIFSLSAFALDHFDEDFSSGISSWSNSSKNGTMELATLNGSNVLHLYVDTAAAGNAAYAWQNVPVNGNIIKLSYRVLADVLRAYTVAAPSWTFGTGSYQYGGLISTTGTFILSTAWGTQVVNPTAYANNTWYNMTFVIRNPLKYNGTIYNSTTATVYAYRDGAYVGSLAAGYPTTTAQGYLRFGQSASASGNGSSYVDNVVVESYGTNYLANSTVINTWTDADAGNGNSTVNGTFMNFNVPTSSSTSVARRTRTSLGVFNKFTIELRARFNKLGNITQGTSPFNNSFVVTTNANATISSPVCFAANGVFFPANATAAYEVGSGAVTTGGSDFTTYRIQVDRPNRTGYVWKNGAYVGSGVMNYTAAGQTTGAALLTQYGYNTTTSTDVEYYRLYSDDGVTVINFQ